MRKFLLCIILLSGFIIISCDKEESNRKKVLKMAHEKELTELVNQFKSEIQNFDGKCVINSGDKRINYTEDFRKTFSPILQKILEIHNTYHNNEALSSVLDGRNYLDVALYPYSKTKWWNTNELESSDYFDTNLHENNKFSICPFCLIIVYNKNNEVNIDINVYNSYLYSQVIFPKIENDLNDLFCLSKYKDYLDKATTILKSNEDFSEKKSSLGCYEINTQKYGTYYLNNTKESSEIVEELKKIHLHEHVNYDFTDEEWKYMVMRTIGERCSICQIYDEYRAQGKESFSFNILELNVFKETIKEDFDRWVKEQEVIKQKIEDERIEKEYQKIMSRGYTRDEAKILYDFSQNDVYIQGGYLPSMNTNVKSFYMHKTETTQKVWRIIMKDFLENFNTPINSGDNLPVYGIYMNYSALLYFCNTLSDALGLQPVYDYLGSTKIDDWGFNINKGSPDRMSRIFIEQERNGYRIPFIDEWVYAVESADEFKYPGSNDIDEVAWYSKNSDDKLHEVGLKKPNKYGLYDMAGNANELLINRYRGLDEGYFGGTIYTSASDMRFTGRGKTFSIIYSTELNDTRLNGGFRLVRGTGNKMVSNKEEAH